MQRAKPPRRRERSKRCRRGVWPRSIATDRFLMSPLLHLAPAVGAGTCGVASRGRSSQIRGVVQHRGDVTASGSCLVDTHCGGVYGVRLPCGQSSFPVPACCAVCCGVSDEQESGAAAGSRADRECRRQVTAGCRGSSGSPSLGSARVAAGAPEQDSELCTMPDFSRRVPLDELRGRGPMKGLQERSVACDPAPRRAARRLR